MCLLLDLENELGSISPLKERFFRCQVEFFSETTWDWRFLFRDFKIMNSICLMVKMIYTYIFKFNFIYFFIQQVLVSHQFYTHQCIHVNPNRPIHHTPTPPAAFPPWCPYVCSLHLCLNFCPTTRFICTIFLGSTYMR